jgi:single-stranded-DNA-specific exonuclease
MGAFRTFIDQRLADDVRHARAETALLIDGTVMAGGAKPELIEDIEKAGPFGSGQAEPLFVLPAHRLVDSGVVGTGHVRARFKSGDGAMISAIAFRAEQSALGQALLKGRGIAFHVAGSLAIDRYGGGQRAQLRITDLAETEPHHR